MGTGRVTLRSGINLGLDHIEPPYLAAPRVTARRAELVAQGYRPDLATLAVRLEGRENTLLDGTASRLSQTEERELQAVQELLTTLLQQATGGVTA